ncbi:MAG: VanZ family protein [Bacteroidales bacterium]|nr:VanZ family protein [Bacteroidales bacterium]
MTIPPIKKNLIAFWSWTFFILLITLFPGNYIPKPTSLINLFQPDKIVHLLIFMPFSYFWLEHEKYKNRKYLRKFQKYIPIFIVGTIYASTTELIQYFVQIGRNGNIYDFIADCFGILLGIIVFDNRNRKTAVNIKPEKI